MDVDRLHSTQGAQEQDFSDFLQRGLLRSPSLGASTFLTPLTCTFFWTCDGYKQFGKAYDFDACFGERAFSTC